MKTVIIMASSIKEAKSLALEKYGSIATYVKPYRYASKGNNFYQFRVNKGLNVYQYLISHSPKERKLCAK